MPTLHLQTADQNYQIEIGQGILETSLVHYVKQQSYQSVAIVTDTNIARVYPALIENLLKDHGISAKTCVLPSGEQYKNLQTLTQIFDFLFEVQATRHTLLIAFGGGVIGDMAGLASALFMRGMPLVQVPTTLLAQVDSSIGGKTAVNLPQGKNTVGVFCQPHYVCIELTFLKTLPLRQINAGLVELIKHGIIRNASLFEVLESKGDLAIAQQNDLSQQSDFLVYAIYESCKTKAEVVEADTKEQGLRAILNFGHTLGHLIETHTGYSSYLHGEAVGWGILFASFVSQKRCGLSAQSRQRIATLIQKIIPPLHLPPLSKEQFIELILHDKKVKDATVSFVLCPEIGKAILQKMTPLELWEDFQTWQKEL